MFDKEICCWPVILLKMLSSFWSLFMSDTGMCVKTTVERVEIFCENRFISSLYSCPTRMTSLHRYVSYCFTLLQRKSRITTLQSNFYYNLVSFSGFLCCSFYLFLNSLSFFPPPWKYTLFFQLRTTFSCLETHGLLFGYGSKIVLAIQVIDSPHYTG